MTRIAHIVPSTPPEINGLGDYAHQLWRNWPEPRPEWHVAGVRIPKGADSAWPEAHLHRFEPNASGVTKLLSDIRAEVVVLHYVGYAYARRGAPLWLPASLDAWKRSHGGRLVVMFHELYAKGPPWRSEFWMSPLQRSVASQLVKVADRWICSCQRQWKILTDELRADRDLGALIPIGSNIDPIRAPDWSRSWPLAVGKKLRVVAFGQSGTRARSLNSHKNLLRRLCVDGHVESILLIGKSDPAGAASPESLGLRTQISDDIPWLEAYDLSNSAISDHLLEQHLGLVANPFGILTKSGVYAAYCAHGLLSLIPGSEAAPPGAYAVNTESKPEACAAALSGSEAIAALAITKEFSSVISWPSITSAWSAHLLN